MEPHPRRVGTAPPGASSASSGDIEVLDPSEALGIGTGSDILVVDDDPGNLVAYEAALAPLGRTLVLVRSGLDALAKLLEADFALLLLDVSMPGLNGIETARMIRSRQRNKRLPIIFITGVHHHDAVVVDACAVGTCDFVAKPILPEVLRAKVALYLQLQERTQQLLRQVGDLRRAEDLLARSAEHARAASLARPPPVAHFLDALAAIAGATSPGEVADRATRLGAQAIAADAAAMWLAEPDGRSSLVGRYAAAGVALDEHRLTSPGAAGALDHGGEVWVTDAADTRGAPEAGAVDRFRAFVRLPLGGPDRPRGQLWFGYLAARAFTEDEQRFLRTLARTCEQALERRRPDGPAADGVVTALAARDRFLRAMVHELRNAMAPTHLLADQLTAMGSAPAAPPGLASRAQMLTRTMGKLVSTVDRVGEVASLWQGHLVLDETTFDLVDVVADVCRELEREATTAGAILAFDREAAVTGAWDLARVKRIVGALISNAIRYAGGRIEIAVTARGTTAELSVRDAGPGLPPDRLPRLFELFEPPRTASERPKAGFGTSLWVARTLCTAMRGSITAENLPAGGACFTVALPRGPEG